ncbi:MAG: hypothetical protein EXX96DRAFT_351111 [Benjaminiella poitrasii]|nr:MAG: hypothetical protein EXX96DRAFT_351111 [Benjaminiella poitrasii]
MNDKWGLLDDPRQKKGLPLRPSQDLKQFNFVTNLGLDEGRISPIKEEHPKADGNMPSKSLRPSSIINNNQSKGDNEIQPTTNDSSHDDQDKLINNNNNDSIQITSVSNDIKNNEHLSRISQSFEFENEDNITSYLSHIINNKTISSIKGDTISETDGHTTKGHSTSLMPDPLPLSPQPESSTNSLAATTNTIKIEPPLFSFQKSQFNFHPPTHHVLANKLKDLQTDLEDENKSPNNIISVGESSQSDNRLKSERPIKQPRKTNVKQQLQPQLSVHHLSSYQASPKYSSCLITESILIADIAPDKTSDDETYLHFQNPNTVQENLFKSLTFKQKQSSSSEDPHYFANIIFELEQHSSITQWYKLKKLDLSRQNLTSINTLDTCFPMLEELHISHNELKSVSGLPTSLLYIYACDNKLCDIEIYHLDKLQYLDVSHNHINSFQDMSQLKSLRVLDASHNMLTSCKSFQKLPQLISLSLKANCLRRLTNFEGTPKDNQLESLDVSFNRIDVLGSIESLTSLRELNADHNDIKHIHLNQPLDRLCKLSLSFNRLKSFDMSPFPDIRVLYLDDNQIERIIGAASVLRLDSFSLRDQGRQQVEFNIQYLRGARKLYLSGSPFENLHRMYDFYSLEYLELCAANIEELPPDFSKFMPNLATLYLGTNRLSDIRPLRKLKYLRRLVLIDNRLTSFNEVINVVYCLKQLNYLDLRTRCVKTYILQSTYL